MEQAAHFPTSILTERLSLRWYTLDSASELFHLVERNRTKLQTSFSPMAEKLTRLHNVVEFISDSKLLWDQGSIFQYGIHRRLDDRLIGQIKVKNIDAAQSTIELSYFIDKDWLHQGFASESVLAIVRLAFLKLQFSKINIRVIASNIESLNMAHKLGFAEEKIRKQDFLCGHGKVHDVHYLALRNNNLH
jgi:RimJ/RimL family protein N-acetyltransferase